MDEIRMNEFPVTIYGKLEPFTETTSIARCRIFYKYANRNGTYITDEFAEKLIATLPYTPIKGIYEDQDYTSHGSSNAEGRIYGVVPLNNNFAWEDHMDDDGVIRSYACTDVILYTGLYPEAKEIVGKCQSMELYPPSIKGEWQTFDGTAYYVFSEGAFFGLQVLGAIDGEKVDPCFQGAEFFSLIKDLTYSLKQLEEKGSNFLKIGGQEKMRQIKTSVSDTYSEIWKMLDETLNSDVEVDTIKYSITEINDEYALAFDHERNVFEKVFYKVSENECDGKKKKCYSIDRNEPCHVITLNDTEFSSIESLKNENNGTFENIENIRNDKISELSTKVEEYAQKEATWNTEKQQGEERIAELENYKKEREVEDKKELIQTYSNCLEQDVLDSYSEKIDSYSYIDLDKELAYALRKATRKSSSATSGIIPTDSPLSGLEEILNKYNH